jgi:hypothetical protein
LQLFAQLDATILCLAILDVGLIFFALARLGGVNEVCFFLCLGRQLFCVCWRSSHKAGGGRHLRIAVKGRFICVSAHASLLDLVNRGPGEILFVQHPY